MIDRVIIGNKSFDSLVAITREEVKNGLMYQSWPPPIMAFPFSHTGIRKFWMKNTISPLDIVFCKSNRIIGIFEGKPLSLDFIGPDEFSDLVIEFPKGTVKKNNISIGDNVKLSYSIFTLSKIFKNNYLFKKSL